MFIGPTLKQVKTGKVQRLSYVFAHEEYGIVGLTTRQFDELATTEYLLNKSRIKGQIIREPDEDLSEDELNSNEFLCSLFDFTRSTNLLNSLSSFNLPNNGSEVPKILGRREAETSLLGIYKDNRFIEFGPVHSICDIAVIELEGRPKKFSNVISIRVPTLENLRKHFAPLSGLMLCDEKKNLVGTVFGAYEDLLMIAPIDSVMLAKNLRFVTSQDIKIHDKTLAVELKLSKQNSKTRKPINNNSQNKSRDTVNKNDALSKILEDT